MKKNKYSFFLILLLFSFTRTYCQNNTETKSNINLFNNFISKENSDLYKGTIYKTKLRKTSKSTNFYKSGNFILANIKYNHNWFYNVETKYDIYFQRILVKLPLNNKNITIELFNDSIQEFWIDGKKFVNLKNYGFMELVLENQNFKVFKKYKKERKEVIINNRTYNQFKIIETNLLIKYKDNFYQLKKDKDLLQIFTNNNMTIKTFFKENKKLKRKNEEDFYIKCLKTLSNKMINN